MRVYKEGIVMAYRIPKRVREQAKKYGVTVKPSTNRLKKIDVFKNGKKVASVGGIRPDGTPYNDYPTYIRKYGMKVANKYRRAYEARHAKDRKVRNSNGWYADKLLWK